MDFQSKVLVDTSYVVYNTAFVVWRWYKEEHKPVIQEGVPFKVMDDPEFVHEFERRFKYRIHTAIRKNVLFFKPSDVYFCLDCNRKSIWRKSISPEYKLKRSTKVLEIDHGSIFKRVLDHILPDYEEEGYNIIKAPFAEGDDVIAVCSTLDPDIHTYICSCDSDLLQLLQYPNITIFDMNGDVLTIESKLKTLKIDDTLTPKEFLLMKIIMGDTSDEIKPIHIRCGPKTAHKYLKDKTLLKDAFNKYPKSTHNFNINRQLIDLTYIPEEIKQNIILEYNKTKDGELDGIK